MARKGVDVDTDVKLRVAIVDADRCKPVKCRQECKRSCPVVRAGKMCIEVGPNSRISYISESLCIGCGICVRKCPFTAINIVNLPATLATETIHRFSANSFKLHRLPIPRPGSVLGLVGCNGMGKSTALQILSGKVKPNLGKHAVPPEWKEVLSTFRGSELQGFFAKLLDQKLTSATKPQYVDSLAKTVKGTVGRAFAMRVPDTADQEKKDHLQKVVKQLALDHLLERNISDLSGGELQRFAICMVLLSNASVLIFDEPSGFLDIRQRIEMAKTIREHLNNERHIIVVEHDLAVLDYLSDIVCCLWGAAGAYGVVTKPFGVREGINVFLDGYIPTENMRFRQEALNFRFAAEKDDLVGVRKGDIPYPSMKKTLGSFKLEIEEGAFEQSECIVMMGENGCGKTTFIRMLAGLLAADPDDDGEIAYVPKLNVSYKPQTIAPTFDGTVEELLRVRLAGILTEPNFASEVVKPMNLSLLMSRDVKTLSGGELQRVALVLALGKPADVYLLDEPSAYLDVEQRVEASRMIKRFITNAKKTAFIVEHDFIMATYLADKVIVYSGTPGVSTLASKPCSLVEGFNRFLKSIDVTFRRDPTNFRPRINKGESVKDKEQKLAGEYFVVDELK